MYEVKLVRKEQEEGDTPPLARVVNSQRGLRVLVVSRPAESASHARAMPRTDFVLYVIGIATLSVRSSNQLVRVTSSISYSTSTYRSLLYVTYEVCG